MGPAKTLTLAWESLQPEWVWVPSAGGSAGDEEQRGQSEWYRNPWADSAAASGWELGSTPGSASRSLVPAPPSEAPPGFHTGFGKGMAKGMAKGYGKGYNEGINDGYGKGYDESYYKGYTEGFNDGAKSGWMIFQGRLAASSDAGSGHPGAKKYEKTKAPEPETGGTESKRKKSGKSGKTGKWFADFMAQDPPDQDKYPRFEVWIDTGWGEYQEKVNEEIRERCITQYTGQLINGATVEVKLGEEPEWQYLLIITPEADELKGKAIDNVEHHKFWDRAWERDVVGYQMPRDNDVPKKARPVRMISKPEAA